MKATMRMLAASTLIALAPMAGAASTTTTGSGTLDTQVKVLDNTGASRGQALVASRIASSFTNLAGSDANALALVNGLRTGSASTLTFSTTSGGTTTTSTTTITPPTKPMGWGNVKIALALAQAQLQQLGITNPTADQLQAALNGGTIKAADGTSVTLKGVLTMRADGMGWGQIAQAGGTKLGPVVSSLRQTQAKVAALPVSKPSDATATNTTTTSTTTGKGKAGTVTTASGGSATTHGKSSKGLTTAGGDNSSKGLTTAGGTAAGSSSQGLVTAGGATVSHGPSAAGTGHGQGAGIVTAAGGGAGNTAATTHAHGGGGGAGIVSGAGGGAGAGVTTAHGNSGGGQGNAGGNGKGKGG